MNAAPIKDHNTVQRDTISPSEMDRRANRPHPCIPDLPGQTRFRSVNCGHEPIYIIMRK